MEPDSNPTPDYDLPAPILIHRSYIAILRGEPTAPCKTTGMGFDIVKTFTIHESESVGGAIQYELLEDDESVWVGMGDDRVDGLLKVIMRITDQEPETPNN